MNVNVQYIRAGDRLSSVVEIMTNSAVIAEQLALDVIWEHAYDEGWDSDLELISAQACIN